MKEIINQTFTFANISLHKNYCNINDKYSPSIQKKRDQKDIYVEPYNLCFRLYPKDQYHYFYSNECTHSFRNHGRVNTPIVHYCPITLKNVNKNGEPFETTNSRHFAKYYNNPFAGISIYKIERKITKINNKITIKLYRHTKERGVNKRFFRKHTESITIVFNISNGNFKIVEFNNKKKQFYSNSFAALKCSMEKIYNLTDEIKYSLSKFKEPLNIFNNMDFMVVMQKSFDFKDNNEIKNYDNLIFNTKSFPLYKTCSSIQINFINKWAEKFIKLKQIKISDDGIKLLTTHYPTERYLKKNDRKLVASILDRYGIKSKSTIKLVHTNPNINIVRLVKTCCLFDETYSKYISNIPLSFLVDMTEDTSIYQKNEILRFKYFNKKIKKFSDKEKENIVKIITDYLKHFNLDSVMDMIFDHYEMMERIKQYYPNIKLNSTTYNTFRNEHSELSVIDNRIKKGTSIEYVFDDKMIKEIEKPIEISNTDWIYDKSSFAWGMSPIVKRNLFIPKILKTTEEYVDEGTYMHHCVSGYIDKDQSIIISLRYDNERVTCEYDTRTRRCIQMRYFTNDDPPDYFEEPLRILTERVTNFSGKFTSINKIKKNLQINGKEVPTMEDVF